MAIRYVTRKLYLNHIIILYHMSVFFGTCFFWDTRYNENGISFAQKVIALCDAIEIGLSLEQITFIL